MNRRPVRRYVGEEARILSAAEMLKANNDRMALRTMTADQLAAIVVPPPPRSKIIAEVIE